MGNQAIFLLISLFCALSCSQRIDKIELLNYWDTPQRRLIPGAYDGTEDNLKPFYPIRATDPKEKLRQIGWYSYSAPFKDHFFYFTPGFAAGYTSIHNSAANQKSYELRVYSSILTRYASYSWMYCEFDNCDISKTVTSAHQVDGQTQIICRAFVGDNSKRLSIGRHLHGGKRGTIHGCQLAQKDHQGRPLEVHYYEVLVISRIGLNKEGKRVIWGW